MRKRTVLLASTMLATTAFAEETRQLDAHVHGVGELNIAIDGNTVAMELHAPGADIVGFEYEAKSAEDRAAVDMAVATLARPLDLFVLPAAAECSVTQASAELEAEDDHEEHDHDHDHDDHADSHDDHADNHNDHADDHAEHDDDHADHDKEHSQHDHDHADHDEEHAEHNEDHAGHEHADEESHTEFHAEYELTCGDPTAITDITFAYFETFENALELEIQIVTDAGAQAFEVERDAPVLDLRSLF